MLEWIELDEWASPEQSARLRLLWENPQLVSVQEALQKSGIEPLLVGGAVRDLLLSRAVEDLDLVVTCSARELIELQTDLRRLTGATPIPLDPVRGTVRLAFGDAEEIDLVALQGETVKEDLLKRDLTINAMAIDRRGSLADPTGGRRDLANRTLRQVDPGAFRSDPLRVLRALRFTAQLKFVLDEDTLRNALVANSNLDGVAGERIARELKTFFSHAQASHIELAYRFDLSHSLGVLSAPLPQMLVERLVGINPVGFELGLALLFRPRSSENGEALFDRLKLSRRTQTYLEQWWSGCERLQGTSELGSREIYRLYRRAPVAFADLARVACLSEFPSKLSRDERSQLQREARGEGLLRWDPFPWNGTRLAEAIGRPPGRWVGEVLGNLGEAWALREVSSDTEIERLAQSFSANF